jgi:phenylacetate-CoA ligase
MLRKLAFKAGYSFKRPNVIRYYNDLQKTQWQSLEWLKSQQEKKLSELLNFAYVNVPYYTQLFQKLGIKPDDIVTVKDLEKLPVLTKHIIKENRTDFIPKNINTLEYMHGSTGGSTGNTLQYRLSVPDREIGSGLLYRGWGYGGYKLGDKVVVIAGSSLIPTTMSEAKRKVQEFFLNFRRYSSFEMSQENLFKYFRDINSWKPTFLRGYVSSIYLFARFIQDNNLKLNFQPKAIFTTSEKLFDKQREVIEKVFYTKVFDNYGLNDGGVSAYECEEHDGMHIDMERAILEVVDEEDKQVINQEGRVLATSLYNYAMPFIRYDTGDLSIISDSECACGRKMPLLKGISGRANDSLKLNGISIGGTIITVLMGKFDIEQYQIIQEDANSITCKIVKGKTYKDKDEKFITESFYSHVGKINIDFDYVDSIPTTKASKYKFIINKLEQL